MNKNLLFSILAFTACAFADGDTINSSAMLAEDSLVAGRMDSDCKPKPPECKPKPKPCEPCVRKAMQPVVLTSSRPCNNVGLYMFADALYWHADVSNSDWAYVSNAPVAAAPSSGSNKELSFKWNWGFRVGLGLDLDHDQWDTNLYYTWFRNNTSSNSFTTPAGGGASSLTGNIDTTTFVSGSASGKLNFNVLDWELGRAFYVSNSLSLRPHVGVKLAWIKLLENDSYATTTAGGSYTVRNTNKSRAVGPSAGVNTNWYFGSGNTMDMRDGHRGEVRNRPGFSIFGDVSGALMYGRFKNSHSETATSAAGAVTGGFAPSHLNRNLMVPVLTGLFGLAWDTCFSCDKMHFGIRAGYELQYWFRESQRFAFGSTGATPTYSRSTDDLALQGLTLDVRFDF
jgi:hypothetical protein